LPKGGFSEHWTQIQDRHIVDDPYLDHEKQTGDQWLKLVLHHLWTVIWQVWLIRNEDPHGHDKDENERKRLKKLHPRVVALYAKKDSVLARDKTILALPIHDTMRLHSRVLETWVNLVTPPIKQAITDAQHYLGATIHTINDFHAHARPDPLMTNELVNELHPVPRMQEYIIYNQNFPDSFLVASPSANANCAHAAHTGLSQVQVVRGWGGIMRRQ
jgi:hypothetical protein